jgi:hypothetical protein
MARHKKMAAIVYEILEKDHLIEQAHLMTVRQVYYQLVSRQVIENTQSKYRDIRNLIVHMKNHGKIPRYWVEDGVRKNFIALMWDKMKEYGSNVVNLNVYLQNIWEAQEPLVEVWLEKDTLLGFFLDLLMPYGIVLNVGREYDGWLSYLEANSRYVKGTKLVKVLYFGDWNPSCEDRFPSLQERNKICLDFTRCALLKEDIKRYKLPPDFTKITDIRRDSFIARYGDEAVELDALPPDVLRDRIKTEVEARVDIKVIEAAEQERQRRKEIIEKLE